jgi:hypothetical protein
VVAGSTAVDGMAAGSTLPLRFGAPPLHMHMLMHMHMHMHISIH